MENSGAVAPEFQLVNESSVGGYLNYMQGGIRNGIYVNAPELPNNASTSNNGFDIKASYVNELALAGDADALVARLNLLLCAGQLSAATVKLITDALKVLSLADDDLTLREILATGRGMGDGQRVFGPGFTTLIEHGRVGMERFD